MKRKRWLAVRMAGVSDASAADTAIPASARRARGRVRPGQTVQDGAEATPYLCLLGVTARVCGGRRVAAKAALR